MTLGFSLSPSLTPTRPATINCICGTIVKVGARGPLPSRCAHCARSRTRPALLFEHIGLEIHRARERFPVIEPKAGSLSLALQWADALRVREIVERELTAQSE